MLRKCPVSRLQKYNFSIIYHHNEKQKKLTKGDLRQFTCGERVRYMEELTRLTVAEWVKVKENWRNLQNYISDFGYNDK